VRGYGDRMPVGGVQWCGVHLEWLIPLYAVNGGPELVAVIPIREDR